MDLTKVILKGYAIRQKDSSLGTNFDPPVSVDDLKEIIENETKTEIKFYELCWNSKGLLKGRLDRYKNSANIFIADTSMISPCWQRFVAVKEMCHLVIDSPNTYTHQIENLISEIVYPGSRLIWDCSEQIQSEALAELLAAEFLLPWTYRDHLIKQIQDGTKTTERVAESFKVPLKKVEWILSPNIHQAITETHNQINSVANTNL